MRPNRATLRATPRDRAPVRAVERRVAAGDIETSVFRDGVLPADVRTAWQELLDRLPDTGFFAGPDWTDAWCENILGPDDPPVVIAVHRKGQLVAILPLVVQGFGLHRTGYLIGSGSGQYGELLADFDGAGADAVCDALWTGIGSSGLDAVAFDTVRSGSTLDTLIARHHFVAGAPTWSVEVDLSHHESLEAYMASRSSNLRKNLRRRRRKLAELGTVTYRVIDREEDIPPAVERVVSMKLDWLADKGLHGRFLARDDVLPWLSDVAIRALRAGALHFSVLTVGQKIVAAQLGFLSRDRLTGYLAAFDLDFAQYAVGKLHLEDHIADIAHDGRILDMMAPDDAYKREWGVPVHTVRSYRVPITALGRGVALMHNPRMRDRLKAAYLAIPGRWRAAVAATGLGMVSALTRRSREHKPQTSPFRAKPKEPSND